MAFNKNIEECFPSNCHLKGNYVPLDYIKAEIIGLNTQSFIQNLLLSFGELIDSDTAEVIKRYGKNGILKKPCRTAVYKNLIFKYYPNTNRLFISGSLHTFFNDGKHNHNDFDLSAFRGVVSTLYSLFGILPQNLFISQLEFGVNIIPPVEANLIIDHCICHIRVMFENRNDSVEGKFIQANHKNYYKIKIYNKGLQYGLGRNIIRVERKQTNWLKYCKQNNIGRTLQDLIDNDFIGLKKTLLLNWNEMLFFDPFLKLESALKYRDKLYWKPDAFNNRVTRKRHFDRLRKMNVEIGKNIQGKISDLITNKIIELSS